MKNLLRQDPFDRYFSSPVISYAPQAKRRTRSRIKGISKFMKHLETPRETKGLFVAGPSTEKELMDVFSEIGTIKSVNAFKRYAFVLLEEDADINSIVGRYHNIGNRQMYVDRIRGGDHKFMPVKYRNRVNLWYDHKNKFK